MDPLSARKMAAVRSTKGKAPPPPAAKGLDGQRLSLRLLGSPLSAMDQQENLMDRDLNLTVVLPGGVEQTATVPGSQPMMDLLVMLCAKYHLNPSSHTIELVSTNRNHIKFKPNALIGSLEAEKILLKPKGVDEKSKKAGPQMPEATVRLVINYKKTQKTILRVSPRVPLEELMPAVCEKCEFDPMTSVLLRNVQSEEPLDMTKSLNDLGLREVYAKDTKSLNLDLPSSPIHGVERSPSFKGRSLKEKENKGLFGMFRRSRKKSEQGMTVSAPTSPVLCKPRPASMPLLGASASVYNSNITLSEVPKKRRAPPPPGMAPPNAPSNLSDQQATSSSETLPEGEREACGIRRASESSLRRTKRKAPPPPSSPSAVASQDEALEDGSVKAGLAPQSPLEEISEQEEMLVSAPPDSAPGPLATDVQTDGGSPGAPADVPMDSEKSAEPVPPPADTELDAEAANFPPPPDDTGEDQSNDLSSDGKPAEEPVNDEACTEQKPNTVETLEQDNGGTDLSPPAEVPETVLAEGAPALGDAKEKSDSGVGTAPGTPETSAPTSTPAPRPVMRDAETLTSDEQSGEAPRERAEVAVAAVGDAPANPAVAASPALPDVQRPTGSPASETGRPKRDMSTSTEVPLPQGEATPASPQDPKSQPLYLLDYGPKPKPSNEVTRDYIPKVGLTTYTIVPQKSLRFFEVELTLEAPGSAPGQLVAIPTDQLNLSSPTLLMGSPVSNGRVAGGNVVYGNSPPVHSPPAHSPLGWSASAHSPPAHSPLGRSPPAHSPLGRSPPAHSPLGRSPPPHSPLGRSPPAHSPLGRSPSAYSPPAHSPLTRSASTPTGNQPSSPKKIPPPTKPKPGSFRLSMHKRTPGYVTSAAVKSAHASGLAEVPGRPDARKPAGATEESFPPPPPPTLWTEESVTSQVEPKTREEKAVDGPASGVHGPATNLEGPAPIVYAAAPRPVISAPNVSVPSPSASGPTPNASVPPPSASVPPPSVSGPTPSASGPTPNANVPSPSASASAPRLTRQYSLPARDPSVGLSLERLRGFVAPKPYVPNSQSRFARAVSTAIRRSQSFTKGSVAEPQPPRVRPVSPLDNQHSIKELAEPSGNMEEAQESEEQLNGETGGAVPSKTPGMGDQDTPADATSAAREETDSPAVPNAVSLNGRPTEI